MSAAIARSILFLAVVVSAAACRSPGDPSVISGEALVTSGAEGCPFSLLIAGERYEPISLRPEHAIQGLLLSVRGIVRNRPSTCMIGPGLEIVSSAILE